MGRAKKSAGLTGRGRLSRRCWWRVVNFGYLGGMETVLLSTSTKVPTRHLRGGAKGVRTSSTNQSAGRCAVHAVLLGSAAARCALGRGRLPVVTWDSRLVLARGSRLGGLSLIWIKAALSGAGGLKNAQLARVECRPGGERGVSTAAVRESLNVDVVEPQTKPPGVPGVVVTA